MIDAIFAFTEKTYIEAVWFVAWTDSDFMGCVYRDGPGEPWRAGYRFRYYRDDKAFGSDDVKNTYRINVPEPQPPDARDTLCTAFDVMTQLMADTSKGRRYKTRVCGGLSRFERLATKMPWMHVKVTPPGPERPQ